jgi:hypothetical protein
MMATSKLNDPFVPPYFQNLTVSELLEEAESSERVYPRWWSLVYFTLRKMTHGWPMNAFRLEEKRDQQNYWSSEALHDFTSEIVCNELLKNGQQEYILGLVQEAARTAMEPSESGEIDLHMGLVVHFLKQQINKVLDHRRAPTLTGNLMSRIEPIFEKLGLVIASETATLTLTDIQIEDQTQLVCNLISSLPRFPNTGEERLSRLYETDDLEKFVLNLAPHVSKLSLPIVRSGIERSLEGMSGSITALERVYRTVPLEAHSREEAEDGADGTLDSLSRSYVDVETQDDPTELRSFTSPGPTEGRTYIYSSTIYSKTDMERINGIISELSLREQKYLVLKADQETNWTQAQIAEAIGLASRKKVNDFQEDLYGKLQRLLLNHQVAVDGHDYIIAGVLIALGTNTFIEMVSMNE